MNSTNPIFAQALELPVNEREALVELLLDSLPLADQNDPVEVSDEWQAEIERRIASIQVGDVEPIDARDTLARLRAAIAETGQS